MSKVQMCAIPTLRASVPHSDQSESRMVKMLDYLSEGCKFKSQDYQAAIAGPPNKALSPQLLRCINETNISSSG